MMNSVKPNFFYGLSELPGSCDLNKNINLLDKVWFNKLPSLPTLAESKNASPSSIIRNGDLVAKAIEYWNASDAIDRSPPDKD